MKKILKCVLVALAIFVVPTVAHAEIRYVNAPSGLRLRESYSTESEIITVIPYNTEVEAIGFAVKGFEKWIEIEYGDSTGYVSSKWLRESDEDCEVTDHDGMEYLGNWQITAYTHTGSVCANGNYPSAGYTIACNSLDFGTEVYIDGIGYRTVEDRGPLGSECIDCFMDTYDECIAFGLQYRDVWLASDE